MMFTTVRFNLLYCILRFICYWQINNLLLLLYTKNYFRLERAAAGASPTMWTPGRDSWRLLCRAPHIQNQFIRWYNVHWPKNNLNLCMQTKPAHGWSRYSGICLVFGPDVRVCQQKPDFQYTAAIVQIIFGTVWWCLLLSERTVQSVTWIANSAFLFFLGTRLGNEGLHTQKHLKKWVILSPLKPFFIKPSYNFYIRPSINFRSKEQFLNLSWSFDYYYPQEEAANNAGTQKLNSN